MRARWKPLLQHPTVTEDAEELHVHFAAGVKIKDDDDTGDWGTVV